MDRLIALVGLRWRNDLRALVGMRERALGLALALPGLLLFSAFGALVAYVGLRAVGAQSPELLLPLVSILATGVGLFWALSPLLAGFGFTESHDVARLLHFPIPARTLVVSSLLANLVQPMVLAELPVLLAVAAALGGGPAFLPALVGVAVSFGFVLAGAQLASLLIQGLARDRRLQDMALFLGLAVSFVLGLAPLLVLLGGAGVLGPVARGLIELDLFALSPFAWGARAAVHAGRGEVGAALALATAGAGATGGVLAISAALIERIHRGELSLGPVRARAGTRARMRFSGPIGALLEKDLRTAWREPALKASLLMGLLGPLLFVLILTQIGARGRSGAALMLLATFMGLSTYGANAFGFERRGIALLFGFPIERWRILVAKNLAGFAFRAPGLLTLLAAALVIAPAAFLPPAAAIAGVTLLCAAALDNYSSILFPIAAPAPGQSPHQAASGTRGLGAAAVGALLLLAALAISAPFVFLIWLPLLLRQTWLWLVTIPLAVLGALGAYGMLVAGAARLLERREPDLVARILGES